MRDTTARITFNMEPGEGPLAGGMAHGIAWTKMTCTNCRQAELKDQIGDVAFEVKGEPVLVKNTRALVCPDCGFSRVDDSLVQQYRREAADIYRQKHALLTSEEIRSR